MATPTPPFLFEIEDIKAIAPICDTTGHWGPPDISTGQSRVPNPRQVYRWNARNTNSVTLAILPAGCSIYRQVTVYHCGGRFWIVPYDATYLNVRDVPSDDRSWYPGWRALTFDHRPNSVSSVGFEHNRSRLATQTHSQAWPRQLLPEHYRADRPNGNPGGLQGEIAIILALAAFSAPPQQMAAALNTSFKRGYWVPHNFVSGWADGRGVVVTVYVDPSSSAERLRDFEEGRCGGPIFA